MYIYWFKATDFLLEKEDNLYMKGSGFHRKRFLLLTHNFFTGFSAMKKKMISSSRTELMGTKSICTFQFTWCFNKVPPLPEQLNTNASSHSHGGEPAEQTHAMTEMNGMLCSVLRGPCILEQINTCVHPPNRAWPARSPPISATRPHPALFSGVCVIPGDPQQRRRSWGSVANSFNDQTWLLHKWYQYLIKMIF